MTDKVSPMCEAGPSPQRERSRREKCEIERILEHCPFPMFSVDAADWIIRMIQHYDMTPKPKETKTVFQFRYKADGQRHWKVAKSLLTEDEARHYYVDCETQRHAGPFEVPL